MRDLTDTPEEIKALLSPDNVIKPSNGESKESKGSPLGFGLSRAVNNQGTKKPLVKIDKTSVS